MINPYYDKTSNSVFLRGALNPINPTTNEAWVNEQEALEFIENLPIEVKREVPCVVVKNVAGDKVVFENNTIDVDAGELITVELEIQQNGAPLKGLNQRFRVPVDRDGQQGVKVLTLDIQDGIGKFTTKFETGEFFIDEQTINRRLKPTEFIAMPEAISIVVAETSDLN